MQAGADILCSRCGTPFPRDQKTALTCIVCNEVRPDLDMTREQRPEDNGIPSAESMQMKSGVLRVRDGAIPPSPAYAKSVPIAAIKPPVKQVFTAPDTCSLFEKISPVMMIIAPVICGGACAMRLLERAENFGPGTWYAAGSVFLLLFIASMFAGLGVSALMYAAHARHKMAIRVAFAFCVLLVCIAGFFEVPRRVLIRENDLPAFQVK